MSDPSKSGPTYGLKAALKTMTLKPVHFAAAGKQIVCAHCGGTDFDIRDEVLLNTRGATFLNLDWLNKGVNILTCTRCGRIEWYAERPQPVG